MAQVLIVDDDPGILRMVRRQLAKQHTVVTYQWSAADADAGPRSMFDGSRCTNLTFEVLISDYELGTPRNGLDVLADYAQTPVRILFTGNPELAEQDRVSRNDPRLESVKILPKDADLNEYIAISLGLR